MKLPALWLALAFASGIMASGVVAKGFTFWVVASVVAIATGLCLTLFAKPSVVAGSLALAAWFALGGLATQLERTNVSQDDAAILVTSGVLETKEPLRWVGRLREDPEPTPLGWRYTIDLQSVEETGRTLPVHGGLRLTYYRGSDNETPPAVRAGDTVEALCRARIPRDYLDPGAFDERGYLARQGIELLGALRSTELLHITGSSKPSVAERFARFRGDLLARLDTLFAGKPPRIAVLRAMLLGDRNFINSDIAETFQKTAAFHVLVLAGLHVAALAFFIFGLGRLLRLPLTFITLLTLAVLAAYLALFKIVRLFCARRL
ncbi:MAG: ComEC/Rec2 family competence protein [Candidatus Acidiferrales bacterium]